jgi:hypothetical protein
MPPCGNSQVFFGSLGTNALDKHTNWFDLMDNDGAGIIFIERAIM